MNREQRTVGFQTDPPQADTELPHELGQPLPRAALFAAGTVAEMACLIEDDGSSNCIVPIQDKGRGTPFFCVHDGNGDVLNFRDLAKHMGEGRPFYGIQCVGLDGKEMPFTRIEDMAAHYISEIKKVQTKGPYFIGGYSFGGRVAYVMAQEFQTQGNDIALLAFLDTSAGIGRVPLGMVGWFRRHLSRLRGLRASEIPSFIAMRIENVSVEIHRIVMTGLYAHALSYYQSHARPIPRWFYRPVEANDVIRREARLGPYEGDAVLFQTVESKERNADGKNGWGDLIKGQLTIVPVPGQHHQIVKEPHAKDLASKLVCAIEAVEG